MNTTTKKGLRTNLVDIFANVPPGGYSVYSLDDVIYTSARTKASALNNEAGYNKYSVSIDRVTNTVRIINNDKA